MIWTTTLLFAMAFGARVECKRWCSFRSPSVLTTSSRNHFTLQSLHCEVTRSTKTPKAEHKLARFLAALNYLWCSSVKIIDVSETFRPDILCFRRLLGEYPSKRDMLNYQKLKYYVQILSFKLSFRRWCVINAKYANAWERERAGVINQDPGHTWSSRWSLMQHRSGIIFKFDYSPLFNRIIINELILSKLYTDNHSPLFLDLFANLMILNRFSAG